MNELEPKENKKKTMVLMIIGVVTMIAFVVGATYAFFTVATSNNATNTNVSGNTEGLGGAALANPTPKLHIHLSASDLSKANTGKVYYATNNDLRDYDTEENKRSIAIASVSGGQVETKNQCGSTLTIDISGTMKDALVTGDGKIVLTPTSGVEIDTTEIDLKDLADKTSITIPVIYKITGSEPQKIEATMLINNTDKDQMPLAGKEININITNTSFKCEVVQEFSPEIPVISKFYINDETTTEVTDPNVTLHLKWNDILVSEYCINEENNVDSCTWKSAEGIQGASQSYTFTSPGTKEFYAFIKNSKNTSLVKTAGITYKKPGSTGSEIVDNPISGVLEPTGTAQDELATRFYGTNPPNYICFGTKDKETCTGDQDKYMYRIIGVDKSGRYKVIKKEALNTAYQWHSANTNTTWADAELKANLNGSYFLTNSTYMPSGWSDKIETMPWKYGDITNQNQEASAILQTEQAWTSTTSAQIGLMYMADYYYAYQKAGLNCSSSGQYNTCETSWIHLSQNDSTSPNANEWTMVRYGSGAALYVNPDGYVNPRSFPSTYSVRPVFYLKAEIAVSGSGTIDDPYLIVN